MVESEVQSVIYWKSWNIVLIVFYITSSPQDGCGVRVGAGDQGGGWPVRGHSALRGWQDGGGSGHCLRGCRCHVLDQWNVFLNNYCRVTRMLNCIGTPGNSPSCSPPRVWWRITKCHRPMEQWCVPSRLRESLLAARTPRIWTTRITSSCCLVDRTALATLDTTATTSFHPGPQWT